MGSLKRKKTKKEISDDERVYPLENEPAQNWISSNIMRTALVLAGCVLIFIMAVTFGLYQSLRSELVTRADTAAEFFTRYIAYNSAKLAGSASTYVVNYSERNSVEMQLIGLDGAVIVSSSGSAAGSVPNGRDAARAISGLKTSVWFGNNSATGELVMACSAPVLTETGNVAGAVRCISALSVVNLTIFKLFLLAVGIAGLVCLCVSFTTRRLYRAVMVPISRINDTAQMIADGTYGVHINTVYPGEIGQLCHTLNDMSDAISRSEKLKNDFISSVSHELRTPLTAIGGWGETLLAGGPGDGEEMRRGLTIITSEASRLAHMVEELLDFSRMESGNLTMRMERIDLTPDIEDVVFMYMDAIRKEGITLEYDEADELPEIIGDRNRLRQVFLNLLDNAIKHGGEGKRVRVEAYTENQTLIISVRDFGPGIPSEELPHVKERFYKGSSKARGSGIGLAVADEIMKLHGGRLDINSVLGEGTVATMVLPAIIGNPDDEI